MTLDDLLPRLESVLPKATADRRLSPADYAILASIAMRRGFDSAVSFIRHLGPAICIRQGEAMKTKHPKKVTCAGGHIEGVQKDGDSHGG